jgi:hypothetical protein
VQYQYGEGDHKYYYGGSDPSLVARAEHRRALDELMDHPYNSDGYNAAYLHLRLIGQLTRVYSDAAPYVNARIYGYLPVDAYNDANRNVPTYFRKADLVRAAAAQADGSRVVSPHAQPVVDERDLREQASGPATIKPRAIIILPKSKPSPKTPDKQVASVAAASR